MNQCWTKEKEKKKQWTLSNSRTLVIVEHHLKTDIATEETGFRGWIGVSFPKFPSFPFTANTDRLSTTLHQSSSSHPSLSVLKLSRPDSFFLHICPIRTENVPVLANCSVLFQLSNATERVFNTVSSALPTLSLRLKFMTLSFTLISLKVGNDLLWSRISKYSRLGQTSCKTYTLSCNLLHTSSLLKFLLISNHC